MKKGDKRLEKQVFEFNECEKLKVEAVQVISMTQSNDTFRWLKAAPLTATEKKFEKRLSGAAVEVMLAEVDGSAAGDEKKRVSEMRGLQRQVVAIAALVRSMTEVRDKPNDTKLVAVEVLFIRFLVLQDISFKCFL